MELFTIGKLAQLAAVGVETVRFYERRGLLEAPARRPSGYRQYSTDAVARLRFIRRAKELGFTLPEIRQLLDLRLDPADSCSEVLSRVFAKLDDLEARIRGLRAMRRSLRAFADACRANTRRHLPCPLLETLSAERQK